MNNYYKKMHNYEHVLNYWNSASIDDLKEIRGNINVFSQVISKDRFIANINNVKIPIDKSIPIQKLPGSLSMKRKGMLQFALPVFSIESLINQTLKIPQGPGYGKVDLPLSIVTIHKGTKLYRSRVISKDINDFHSLSEQSFWNAPKNSMITSYGRLNMPFQNFLYLSSDPITTFMETKVRPGNNVILSQFIVTKSFKLVDIGFGQIKKWFINSIKQHKIKISSYLMAMNIAKIYNSFLTKQFTMFVNRNIDYKIPITLAQYYYFPIESQLLGWAYPSVKPQVKSLNNIDVCIKSHETKVNPLYKQFQKFIHLKKSYLLHFNYINPFINNEAFLPSKLDQRDWYK